MAEAVEDKIPAVAQVVATAEGGASGKTHDRQDVRRGMMFMLMSWLAIVTPFMQGMLCFTEVSLIR